MPAGEISTAELLDRLSQHPAKSLTFTYEGRDVLPGYHVTEVKSGTFEALDCGASLESWHETFIQLWDVPADDGRDFMPASKFTAITRKVSDRVPFDPDARLTFEVSDGTAAIQIYRASAIEVAGDVVRVRLSRRPASCKPRDRWLEQQQASCRSGAAQPRCCS